MDNNYDNDDDGVNNDNNDINKYKYKNKVTIDNSS